ncbi:NAD-dependent deacylase [Corynebacterium freiburgense]|uniref:NAD-dependent deacylase n=1 Tax=Corynebacterium freiburgense TaxID=556548 RepID=UPI00042390A1|nr:NAD-dependent deacylase [Corynebacterium freiburgense]WJZ03563.1 NAD-dependent protein deacylase [Corynebacterium freiburgense]
MTLSDALKLAEFAQKVEVFTGAGMSAESGIQTYRDDTTGLWENIDPQAMASISAWIHDPEPMWAWYLWRTHLASNAEPNAGHYALARWASISDVHITTQNIDNLHERAGSPAVAHLHGSLFAWRCTICARPYRNVEAINTPIERLTPPNCPLCGNYIRPGVVWFGEALPQREWTTAETHISNADLLVIVGTSGVVQPAASLPLIAVNLGIPILEISPADTELTGIANYSWRATAATALPELVDALEYRVQP